MFAKFYGIRSLPVLDIEKPKRREWTNAHTDGQTDGQMDNVKTVL